MSEWLNSTENEWMSEIKWMNDWNQLNEWMNEWNQVNEWMNDWNQLSEWMDEWLKSTEWVNDWNQLSEWMIEINWVNDWMTGIWSTEWVEMWIYLNKCIKLLVWIMDKSVKPLWIKHYEGAQRWNVYGARACISPYVLLRKVVWMFCSEVSGINATAKPCNVLNGRQYSCVYTAGSAALYYVTLSFVPDQQNTITGVFRIQALGHYSENQCY